MNNSIAEKTKKCNKMEKSHLHLPDEWYKIQKSEMDRGEKWQIPILQKMRPRRICKTTGCHDFSGRTEDYRSETEEGAVLQ